MRAVAQKSMTSMICCRFREDTSQMRKLDRDALVKSAILLTQKIVREGQSIKSKKIYSNFRLNLNSYKL